jgi:signal transduction histidine kinase/CheY-like chemotaxis protein
MRRSPARAIAAKLVALLVTALLAGLPLLPLQAADSAGSLQRQLDDALLALPADFQRALESAQALLAPGYSGPPLSAAERVRAQLQQGKMLLRLGRLDEARAVIEAVRRELEGLDDPAAHIFLAMLTSSSQVIDGDLETALDQLRQALALLDRDTDPRVESALRVNHATVLYIGGRPLQAADVFEEILPGAIDRGDAQVAVPAGNNLVILLMNLGRYQRARYWLDALAPLVRALPASYSTRSVLLNDHDLAVFEGDYARALAGLERFLAAPEGQDDPDLITGNAYRIQSRALLGLGQLPAARVAAETGARLLEPWAHERADALLALAQVMVRQRAFQDALPVLERIEAGGIDILPVQTAAAELALTATLGLGRGDAASAALDRLLALHQRARAERNAQLDRYYEARMAEAKSERELARLRSEEESIRVQTALASERAAATQRNRQLAILLGVALLVLVAWLAGLEHDRRIQKRLREAQRESNRALSETVAEKSDAIALNLERQSAHELELAERRRIESIGLLAGNMAHDFNNLLQIIVGANEVLSSEATTAELRRAVGVSNQSAASASQLVDSLRAFAGTRELEPRPVAVAAYLEANAPLFQTAMRGRTRLEIANETPEAVLVVDPYQLTSALLNLLRNAADASAMAGSVFLRVGDEAGRVAFTVVDEGEGMSREVLAQAAQPFYTTKDADQGTGLGLSSVERFAQASSGTLALHSEPGVGTKAVLSFPRSAETVPAAADDLVPTAVLAGREVLLVEDNLNVGELMAAMLDRLGARVQRCASADEARRLLDDGLAPDLVFSDLRMPGELDGAGLAAWLQAQQPDVPILLVSGYAEEHDRPLPAPVLSKPFAMADLIRFLRDNFRPAPTSAGG